MKELSTAENKFLFNYFSNRSPFLVENITQDLKFVSPSINERECFGSKQAKYELMESLKDKGLFVFHDHIYTDTYNRQITRYTLSEEGMDYVKDIIMWNDL
jgi:hypothetical protein